MSFKGGLVCKAHRLVYHSTLDLRVIKKNVRLPNPSPFSIYFLGVRGFRGWGFRVSGFWCSGMFEFERVGTFGGGGVP